MKISFKNIDFIFLIFLLLLTQGNIPVKVLGVLFMLVIRPRAIMSLHGFNLFYFFIIAYHVIYGLMIIFFDSSGYFPNYIFSLVFWLISFFGLSQITFFFKTKNIETCLRTINTFFLINVVVVVFQFFSLCIDYNSINPYGVTTSAGDFISSIYSNSSVNAMIMSFFSAMYLLRKKWKLGIFAIVTLVMTTYMSGLVIFLCSALISVFLFSKIKIKFKILILIFGFSSVLIFKEISPNNVTYVTRYINRIIKNDENVPFKIKSFRQTLSYSMESFKNFVFGAGGGNFSSRVAFIASGDYVSWYPKSWQYTSEDFVNNHLKLWQHDFRNPWDNRNNTANQPFSFYNQIIGEYGLIGILLFVGLYCGYLFYNRKHLMFSKFILICLLFYFVLDYWFEYFSVIIIFELLVLLDIRMNKLNQTTNEYGKS